MKPKRNFFFVRPKLLLVKLSVVEQSTKIQQTKTATMMTNKKSKSMYSMCMARRDLKVKLLTHFLLFILNIFFRAYESEIVWFGFRYMRDAQKLTHSRRHRQKTTTANEQRE